MPSPRVMTVRIQIFYTLRIRYTQGGVYTVGPSMNIRTLFQEILSHEGMGPIHTLEILAAHMCYPEKIYLTRNNNFKPFVFKQRVKGFMDPKRILRVVRFFGCPKIKTI